MTIEDTEKRSCEGCSNALFADYGYSNYTTEGTEFWCMVGAHPEDGFDKWFGLDERLLFAEVCPRFEPGDPVRMDVDHEGEENLTDAQRSLYDAWQNR